MRFGSNASGSVKGYDVIICSSLTSNVDRDRYGVDMKVREGRFAGGQAFPISGHFAACLYKRKLLLDNDILFDEGIRLNEDEAFKMKAMYAAALIRTKEKFLYTYCVTPGSVRYTDTHIYDFVEAWTKTYQWLEKHEACKERGTEDPGGEDAAEGEMDQEDER